MKCTHIALQVRDIEKSCAFYDLLCGMKPVHSRSDGGKRVVWLGWGEDPPKFVIVLLEVDYRQNTQPTCQHVGMAVDSKEEVDAIYERARRAGITGLWKPVEAGEIVGYYCGAPDPDGNMIEFSYGQRIG